MKPKFRNLCKVFILFLLLIQFTSQSYGLIVVHGKATWSSPLNVNDQVIIDSGSSLTITSIIKFSPTSSITVLCGGRLYVNGGTLTNLVNGQMWPGIKVYGNKSRPQTDTCFHGKVVLKNAIIRNAQCAILLGNVLNNNVTNGVVVNLIDGGGILDALSTQFVNNYRSIHFNQYIGYNYYNNNEVCNKSSIVECDFITDNNAYFNDSLMKQIYLCKVRGIKINGCKFENQRPGQRGGAIYSIEAGVKINELGVRTSLTQSSYYNKKCTFKGYRAAIFLVSPGTTPTIILNSEFYNNVECVRTIDGANNRFESNYIDNVSLGIFFDHSTKFIVENNFISNASAAMYFYNGSIPDNNFLRYNSIINSCNAFYVNGYYSNNVNNSLAQGIKLFCDYFANNTNDIYIRYNSSICFRQGNENENTGNLFDSPISPMNVYNDPTNILLYYFYNNNVAFQDPLNSNNISKNFGSKTPCHGCGFIGDAYYLNQNIYRITTLETTYTTEKADYDIKASDYSLSYSTPIDWNAHYEGRENYEQQIIDFNELTKLKEKLDQTCSDAIKILLSEDELNKGQFKLWISRYETAYTDCLLAECYLNENNFVAMNNVLDSIVIKYNYDPIELAKYKQCMNYLAQWNINNNSSFYVSNSTIDSLQNIASGTGKSSVFASSILLRLGYEVEFNNICSDSLCVDLSKTNIANITEHSLLLIPNPTSDMVSLSVDNGNTLIVKVNIYDIYGKELLVENINSFESKIDLSRFNKGIYFVVCQLENGKSCTSKIVKK